MMTIVTHVTLKEGSEPEWDAAMRERLEAAKNQPGWVGGQLLMPLDPAFAETRKRLEGLEIGKNEHWWHEVIQDVRPGISASKSPR